MVRQKQSRKHDRGQKKRGFHYGGNVYNSEARSKFPLQFKCKLCGMVFGDPSNGQFTLLNCPRCLCSLYIDLWRDGWCVLDKGGFRYRWGVLHRECIGFLVRSGMDAGEIKGEVGRWKLVDKKEKNGGR